MNEFNEEKEANAPDGRSLSDYLGDGDDGERDNAAEIVGDANQAQPENSESEANDGEPPKNRVGDVLDWTACFVYAIAAVLALNLFFFRSITVSGDSMNDTLIDNDKVIATNFMYTPKYGDIVIIEADKLMMHGTAVYGEAIIKRVIATAGDVVRVDTDNGVVYRNGEALEEDYIKERMTKPMGVGWMESNKDYTVPENCVFVMGDNRNNSNDSRNMAAVGFVDTNFIMGKAFVRYAPFSSFKWLS